MRIQPNNISTPRQAKALELARSVMSRIDSFHDAVSGADQGEQDYNKTQDWVVVSNLDLPKEGDNILASRPSVSEGQWNKVDGQSEFNAKVKLPGYFWDVEASVDRSENSDTVHYKRVFEGNFAGPNTTKVSVDKVTGEVDVRQYYLGIIPAKLDV